MIGTTLKELATARIDEFTKLHRLYDEAMKKFVAMLNNDKSPGKEQMGIYPIKLLTVSQELAQGILAYISAAKQLATDYSTFAGVASFAKDYQLRIDYIDEIKQELTQAMTDLKAHLSGAPAYTEGLINGEKILVALFSKLDAAKDAMQSAKLAMSSDEQRQKGPRC